MTGRRVALGPSATHQCSPVCVDRPRSAGRELSTVPVDDCRSRASPRERLGGQPGPGWASGPADRRPAEVPWDSWAEVPLDRRASQHGGRGRSWLVVGHILVAHVMPMIRWLTRVGSKLPSGPGSGSLRKQAAVWPRKLLASPTTRGSSAPTLEATPLRPKVASTLRAARSLLGEKDEGTLYRHHGKADTYPRL